MESSNCNLAVAQIKQYFKRLKNQANDFKRLKNQAKEYLGKIEELSNNQTKLMVEVEAKRKQLKSKDFLSFYRPLVTSVASIPVLIFLIWRS